MAEPIDRISAGLAEGTRALGELAATFDAASDALHADLAAWRQSLTWDRQAPAPLYPDTGQP